MNADKFLEIIDNTPLVSIDIILRNSEGHILLGKRVNKPAEGFWFVPGGRIRKNETLKAAMQRISLVELGFEIDLHHAEMIGAFDHIYDDNFNATDGVNTHYVALGYNVKMDSQNKVKNDSQHSDMVWMSESELINSEHVHSNTKAYFL
ncbi:GDP-mannose mannosyl hydrolase [Marinomonas balearica]|uniref:Colanic acid biosynthesis protein WcaH n=1 Tax=Marinomonas balearica TaxID=491947 RepID=A0A4R6MDU2_9GAMM|nr:GDP-mannose mannosyl hydrolase [Marinomonas balearica]TDO99576.1 colanic acid biosynthesis protein WcaH [Marinomonas balearica]